jgi:hypothetical protein
MAKVAAPPSATVELIDVTPELAREWLGFNVHNRRLRSRMVNTFASDMRAGDWQFNGETIKFAKDGTLLDGQHRLAAIAESGATVKVLVIRNLPRTAQDTVDGGARRQFADVLQLRGERSALALAALVRKVTLWEAGARRRGDYVPTNAQMLQTLDKHPDLRDIALGALRISHGCGLPGSVIGLGMWLFGQIDVSDSEAFFERLYDGQNLARGHPVYELRKATDQRSIRGERSTIFLTAIMIKAWNAYRDGDKVWYLRFRSGGANPETYPEPR